MIVDTHVHVIAADQKKYPLQLAPASTLRPRNWVREMPVTVEELLRQMEGAGVDRAVLVQPLSAYTYDNSYAADSALRYPGRLVSVGIIDIFEKEAAHRLNSLIKERGMAGLRIMGGREEKAARLDEPRTYPVWEQAAALHIPVCIQIFPQHLQGLRHLLERFPAVPVALDHLAQLDADVDPSGEAVSELLGLAKYPNLHLKFSTRNISASGKVSANAAELIRRLVNRFGGSRLMWGSNFPANHECSYKEMINIARQALSLLGTEDSKWLLGETALTLWPALRGR